MNVIEPKTNLKGAKDVFALKQVSIKKDDFPYQGLWLFSGVQGAGKTLTMMSCVLEILEQYPKCIVVSNISLYGVPCYPYTGIKDFEKYTNGNDGVIFIIDEIHTLFNSLESAKMPMSQVNVWCQNRKNHRVIMGTSQKFSRVAKAVREQTALHYECHSPFLGLFYRYKLFDGELYDTDTGIYEGSEPAVQWFVPKIKNMMSYNTLEVVLRNSKKKEEKSK